MFCAPGLHRRLLLLVPLLALAAEQPRPLRISRTGIPLRYVEHEFAIERPAAGVPTFDWKAFELRPPKIVTRVAPACVLENSFLRVVVLPDKGRVQSLRDKRTGREQLWINPAAKPIRAHNDTGFWVTWGGIENVLPRGEHGTSHALHWRSRVEDEPNRIAVRMWSVEPLTGLEHAFTAALYRDRNYLETTVEIRNPSSGPKRADRALYEKGGRPKQVGRTPGSAADALVGPSGALRAQRQARPGGRARARAPALPRAHTLFFRGVFHGPCRR